MPINKPLRDHISSCFTDVALVGNVDGGWSEWNTWSTCSRDCDGGLRWRRRECNDPKPLGKGEDCYGHAMEGQECNAHPCQGNDFSVPVSCTLYVYYILTA